MQQLGHPQFTVTRNDLESQTKMPGTSCESCHLGNPGAEGKEEAHKGLLALKVVGAKWEIFARRSLDRGDLAEWPSLEPRGASRSTQLGPKVRVGNVLKENPKYKLIIYHDKNSETLAFNPAVAEKTCGVCHRHIVQSFLKSPMGGGKGAHTQSQYRAWTGPTGPQSCGVWIGALAAPDQDRFTDENRTYFNNRSSLPIGEKAAGNVQRTCNQCHVGCLDCHYSPGKKGGPDSASGTHAFVRKPPALACYGGGRSLGCHASPLERRRGDGYFRSEFTQTASDGEGLLKTASDVHMLRGLACVDCHEPNRKSAHHGDLRRQVQCSKCHASVVAAHKKGPHRTVDCSSCHTALIGGYAFNFWTATTVAGDTNPITRLQGYLVSPMPPVILKNPKGLWIPVHVVPHTSGNVRSGDVKLSKKLLFRNRPDVVIERRYFSNDSFAVTGLAKNVDDNDRDTLAWLNVDRVAHGIGKSRNCGSCHASPSQKITVKFEASGETYKDVEDGSYTILVDQRGLRVTAFAGPDSGPTAEGLLPFMDKWTLPGDFSLPKMRDRGRYERLKSDYEKGLFVH
jgi:hypothetical protein